MKTLLIALLLSVGVIAMAQAPHGTEPQPAPVVKKEVKKPKTHKKSVKEVKPQTAPKFHAIK